MRLTWGQTPMLHLINFWPSNRRALCLCSSLRSRACCGRRKSSTYPTPAAAAGNKPAVASSPRKFGGPCRLADVQLQHGDRAVGGGVCGCCLSVGSRWPLRTPALQSCFTLISQPEIHCKLTRSITRAQRCHGSWFRDARPRVLSLCLPTEGAGRQSKGGVPFPSAF